MTRRTPLIALLLATLAVTGCAATPIPAATSAAASLTATPTPTPTPTPVGPLAAFDGDCSQVLTTAQRDAILGSGSVTREEWLAENYPESTGSTGPGAILLAGGLSCGWVPAEGADLPEGMESLTVQIYPAAVVDGDVQAALADPRCDPQYDSSSCRQARSVNGIWVMVRAGWEVYEPPVEELSLALDAVTANLADSAVPVAAPQTPGWWTVPECDALGEQIALSEMLGEGYDSGYWEGSVQFEDRILAGAGVLQFCQYSSSSEHRADGYEFMILSVSVEPGGALGWEDGRAEEVTVDIAGAEEAFGRSEDGSWPSWSIRAFDGTNVVSVTSEGDDAAAVVAERVIAVLTP